jgi:hypothetical protein
MRGAAGDRRVGKTLLVQAEQRGGRPPSLPLTGSRAVVDPIGYMLRRYCPPTSNSVFVI